MNKRLIIIIGAVSTLLLLVCCIGVVIFSLAVIPLPPVVAPTRVAPLETPVRNIPPATNWYSLYFTNPQYPDNPDYHQGGIDDRFVAFIDGATQSIDLAIYDFDLDNVATALVRATQRGVKVRMVTDSDTLNSDDDAVRAAINKVKKAKIPIAGDERTPIMHNKFMVVDRREVWTGSWNFTDGDTYRLNNNAIRISSPQLAANYTAEFEKMFTEHKFGPKKPAGVPSPQLTVNGVHIENYFAPEDGVADKVITRIKGAHSSIYFMAFSFTHDGIGTAMIDRAKQGIKVAGIFESTGSQTQYSEYGKMKKDDIEVYTDGNPYIMHHKVIIIDEQTVIFGSFNFSENADKQNDENLLIIDDPEMARAFKAEYNRVLQVAKNPPTKEKVPVKQRPE